MMLEEPSFICKEALMALCRRANMAFSTIRNESQTVRYGLRYSPE